MSYSDFIVAVANYKQNVAFANSYLTINFATT